MYEGYFSYILFHIYIVIYFLYSYFYFLQEQILKLYHLDRYICNLHPYPF